jgi:hypothetical protein
MSHLFCLIGLLAPALALAASTSMPSESYPTRILANGSVRMQLYLPDTQRGYYRGARFDWSGVIGRVEYKGHTFYAPWKSTHDPGNHDDVSGPVSEFSIPGPLGYAQAKPGETFIKIGVGHLRKPRDAAYAIATRYEIVKPGEWKIDAGDDWIEFTQQITDDRGWGYQYTKRIELLKDAPGFVMLHRLKNTGTNAIDTSCYNHNFTKIDDVPVGPAYRLIFPFDLHAIERKLNPPAQVNGNQIIFTGDIAAGASFMGIFDGFKTPADNAVIIRNGKTGAAIHITGDETPMRLAVWGTSTCACPEIYVPIKLAPGEEKKWSIRHVLAVD